MQVLVDDLLLLARSGRPDFVTPGWVEADDLLEDVLNRVRVLGERQWHLEAKPGGLIRADRRRLTQALEQLAANAVNHTSESDRISVGGAWVEDDDGTPQGGRAVVVREPADSASRELEIWVSDTGTGIPAEDHERIFERFGKGSNSAAMEGSGLGAVHRQSHRRGTWRHCAAGVGGGQGQPLRAPDPLRRHRMRAMKPMICRRSGQRRRQRGPRR